jgi:pantothenate kinase-related protein Tda10
MLADSQQPAGIASSQRLRGVPLILGIWGPKGCGKSFNIELACKLMGVTPVVMRCAALRELCAI